MYIFLNYKKKIVKVDLIYFNSQQKTNITLNFNATDDGIFFFLIIQHFETKPLNPDNEFVILKHNNFGDSLQQQENGYKEKHCRRYRLGAFVGSE